jgi:hypothetical protein
MQNFRIQVMATCWAEFEIKATWDNVVNRANVKLQSSEFCDTFKWKPQPSNLRSIEVVEVKLLDDEYVIED